jgi:hypothetical protein
MATSTLPLVFREDSGPKYDWFGAFDYSWFDSPGNLSTVPYFEATPELLGHVLRNSTARQELTLGFVPHDCTTVNGTRNCTEACSNPDFPIYAEQPPAVHRVC